MFCEEAQCSCSFEDASAKAEAMVADAEAKAKTLHAERYAEILEMHAPAAAAAAKTLRAAELNAACQRKHRTKVKQERQEAAAKGSRRMESFYPPAVDTDVPAMEPASESEGESEDEEGTALDCSRDYAEVQSLLEEGTANAKRRGDVSAHTSYLAVTRFHAFVHGTSHRPSLEAAHMVASVLYARPARQRPHAHRRRARLRDEDLQAAPDRAGQPSPETAPRHGATPDQAGGQAGDRARQGRCGPGKVGQGQGRFEGSVRGWGQLSWVFGGLKNHVHPP